MPDTLSREERWIEIIARALPDIPSEDTHRYVYGDDVPYLDAAEEWYTSPREMARQMVGPLLAHLDALTAADTFRYRVGWFLDHNPNASDRDLLDGIRSLLGEPHDA